ncbi:MAG: SDR family oxidoreductase [Bacteroidales bacterium]|nr:SDR family oxidoreductase [Bacteroidales bacterium]
MNKKIILITGSTRGIGFALTTEFLKSGHKIIINGRSENSVNKAIGNLKGISDNIVGVSGSISEPETFDRLIEKGVSRFGRIDIWINNAGIPQEHKLFWEITDTGIKEVLDTNIYGLLLGTKYAINFFKKQGFGKVFNMQGFGSNGKTMNKLTVYGTSKRAVHYFTKSVSKELKNINIQMGTINPGMVRTDFLNVAKNHAIKDEQARYEKVFRILAEDADVVAEFLAPKIIFSNKDYDQIKFLSGLKLFTKIVKLILS